MLEIEPCACVHFARLPPSWSPGIRPAPLPRTQSPVGGIRMGFDKMVRIRLFSSPPFLTLFHRLPSTLTLKEEGKESGHRLPFSHLTSLPRFLCSTASYTISCVGCAWVKGLLGSQCPLSRFRCMRLSTKDVHRIAPSSFFPHSSPHPYLSLFLSSIASHTISCVGCASLRDGFSSSPPFICPSPSLSSLELMELRFKD